MTAKLNDDQRKQLKHNIMESFLSLIEHQGLKDHPDIKDAYREIKINHHYEIVCKGVDKLEKGEISLKGGHHEKKKIS